MRAQGIGEVIKAVRRELTAKPGVPTRTASKLAQKPKPRSLPLKTTTVGKTKADANSPTTQSKPRQPSLKAPVKQ